MISLNNINDEYQYIAINQTLSNGSPTKTIDVTINDIQYLCLPDVTYYQNILGLIYNYSFSLNNNMITNILHSTANIYMNYQPLKLNYSMLNQFGTLNENIMLSMKTSITNIIPYYSSINLKLSQQNLDLRSFETRIGQLLPTGELS